VTADALIVLGGYLLGSIPFGYVIPRLVRGDDVRRHGSGNVGASNVWRVYGSSLGIPVALLDVAKGFVPALVGLELGRLGGAGGRAAMVGHAPRLPGLRRAGRWSRPRGRRPGASPLAALVRPGVARRVRGVPAASLASMVTAAALPLACLAFGASCLSWGS
jgi:glycerol-3-phosphate acyltransferase PlsY